MHRIYLICSGMFKGSSTSNAIQDFMKFARYFLYEKTGLRIDQPTSDGGTKSTVNIARQCFLNMNEFISWVTTMIPNYLRDPICRLHTHLSVLLRIFNSHQAGDTDKLDALYKDTMNLFSRTFLGQISLPLNTDNLLTLPN